ncbi:hypothetical protein M422DRAFT_54395 [Sphaerobolus stellatus SS14]|uniref:Ubiquitin-like protease family profile domain-containing protein n=1 Tax=Sphaerobolus stellatus (strain SS14) TaxID=990650 RepID=A0A0C9UJ98_SPHS4|nr:hypothetical protein M422DRAFT_54395 [Sphaerobolus stellatus SS14]
MGRLRQLLNGIAERMDLQDMISMSQETADYWWNEAIYRGIKKSASIAVKNQDMARLPPGNRLNDTLISVALELLKSENTERRQNQVTRLGIFNTFIYKEFNLKGHDYVAKWTDSNTLSDHDLIFVPIHDFSIEHWFLAVIHFPSSLLSCTQNNPEGSSDSLPCRIFTFDSLGQHNATVHSNLKCYLKEEFKAKYGRDCNCDIVGQDVEVTRQPNAIDCGIYLLCIADTLFGNPDLLKKKKPSKINLQSAEVKGMRSKLQKLIISLSQNTPFPDS